MINKIKSLLLKVLSKRIVEKISYILYYKYDRCRYVKFSALVRRDDSFEKLVGGITQECHVIEKGLTMPEIRLGFGTKTIMKLIDLCNSYLEFNYDSNNDFFLHSISVLNEYKRLHERLDYSDNKLLLIRISELTRKVNYWPEVTQLEFIDNAYFSDSTATFDKFSFSRHSVRNFNGSADISDLNKAVKLSLNAPSSCNRQPCRVYLIENKDIIRNVLLLQNGNRGFGHLVNNLMLITAELGVYSGINERNSAYIDGGIFTMNLVYSLHFYKVGVCILNCNFLKEAEVQIRSLVNIPESEVLIVLLACGNVPEKFKVTISKRRSIESALKRIV